MVLSSSLGTSLSQIVTSYVSCMFSGCKVEKPSKFFIKTSNAIKYIDQICKTSRHPKNRWSYHLICIRKHTYEVHPREFLKLFKCLTFGDIHMISGWLDFLDNIQFIYEFTWLLMKFKAFKILFVCMLSYFECISIILCSFMLWYKKISYFWDNSHNIILFSFIFEIIIILSWFNDKRKYLFKVMYFSKFIF